MNINDYTINFFNKHGNKIYTFTTIYELEFGRKKNDVGAVSILLPLLDFINAADFEYNSTIEIYRNNKLIPVLWYFIKLHIDESARTIELVFFDHLHLLTRRTVAWYEVDGYNYPGHLRLPADEAIHTIIRTNLGEDVDDNLGYAPIGVPQTLDNMGVDARTMAFTLLDKVFTGDIIEENTAWKPVLSVIQSIAKSVSDNIWFDFIYVPSQTGQRIGTLTFNIWVGIRGNDRTIGATNNPVVFSPDLGNLVDVEYDLDYENYYNQVYVIAKELPEVDDGIQLVRLVAYPEEYENTGINLVEFVESLNEDEINTDIMLARAKTIYEDGKPVRKLTGNIIQLDSYQFLVHYDYGDMISAYYNNINFVAEISTYNITVNESEEIKIPLTIEIQ